MKKLILGSAIVAVLGVASNAMAAPNTGTVNFTGSVSTATCEIGLQDSAGGNISSVNLGTLSTANQDNGTAVVFKLVPLILTGRLLPYIRQVSLTPRQEARPLIFR